MNDISHIVIISSKRSSANFAVGEAIARGLSSNCTIHHIYFTEQIESRQKTTQYCSYPIYNNRKDNKARLIKYIPFAILKRIINSLCYKIENLIDNLFTIRIERIARNVVSSIISERCISAVIATNNPIYAHKVLKWISEKYADILCFPIWLDPYFKRYSKGSFLWNYTASLLERKLFKHFDRIFSLPESFVGDYNITRYKEKHILFEIPFINNVDSFITNKEIIFAGSVVPGLREPDIPFQIIMDILPSIDDDIVFYFYINCPEKFKSFEKESNGRIRICSFISREELGKKLANSYMLLIIGNMNSFQMPSKVVEYISYKKPLVFFQFEQNDPSCRYLNLYPDICKIKLYSDYNSCINNLRQYLKKDHFCIKYDDLLKVTLYKKSTPEYVSNLLISSK